MPNELNKPEIVGELTQEQIEERGREFDRKLYEKTIIGRGVIRCAFSKKHTALLMIPLGLITLYLLFALSITLWGIITNPYELGFLIMGVIYDPLYYLLMLALPLAADILLFNGILGGYACQYKANNLEFIIYRKGRGILSLLYKDAVSVEYKPMKFLWAKQGVHVTIKMKTYSLHFDYVVTPR